MLCPNRKRWLGFLGVALLHHSCLFAQESPLPGTHPLEVRGDLSQLMVSGIDRFALREVAQSVEKRGALWRRDYSSPEAYARSVQSNRERFQKMIGAVDERVPMTGMELVSTTASQARLAETDRYVIYAVRWPVFDQVNGEGLLLQPKGPVHARIVVVPDADEIPEMLAGLVPGATTTGPFARWLVENGAQVIVPLLINRRDEGSGNPRLNRFTNQTHREWIYRQAFEMGRHIIGYEVQKVRSAIDWLAQENERGGHKPIGVAGFAEGGLLAFHAAAVDARIQATLVAGYFDSRQKIWAEPIYRNVFGLLHEFGDAEIASLIAPRTLVISSCPAPEIAGPPATRPGRGSSAAPGVLTTPDVRSSQLEFARAQALCGPEFARSLLLHPSFNEAAHSFWNHLTGSGGGLAPLREPPPAMPHAVNSDSRQLRQLRELEAHTQKLMRLSEDMRNVFFWQKLKPGTADAWMNSTREFKDVFWDEIIGRLPTADQPPNVRTRQFASTPAWTGYEVVLDVWNDVFAWGYLLVPKDLQPGERRPVVICQHGLEGVPHDTINPDPQSRAHGYYKAFAAKLAERGFVVFSPHNPYRGRDEFRGLQRKLNPVKKTIYSVMVRQHERILDWLSEQPFVDATRIGFYGLSYGGKTAMRIPALLDRYAVSICSGDFNEWIRKNTTVDARYSYMFAPEYEIFEFNLGPTFNYAEMAALIAPRPFMVERGHNDGVGVDEWVAYEYAKVRRLYTQLRIPERTAIEYFDGPHTINGLGTFEFLHRHLNWPER